MTKTFISEIQDCNGQRYIIILTSLSPIADVTNYHLCAVFYPMVAPKCWQRLGLLALDTSNEWRAGKSKAVSGSWEWSTAFSPPLLIF